jgi:hypothetical protein
MRRLKRFCGSLAAVLALAGAGTGSAEDSKPIRAISAHMPDGSPSEADCRAAMDQLDDLVSNPSALAYLSTASSTRLARGMTLCRSGHADEGAVLLRRALASIHLPD